MAEQRKISIRFYNDREVRAMWDNESNRWWFSVLDIVGAINEQDDYNRTRNYWKYLKTKLRKQGSEVVSVTNQLKLLAPDGKRRMTDVLDYNGVMLLAQNIPNTNATRFVHWFSSDNYSIDGKSREKAYALWESGLMDNVEIGTTRGLQQIHGYLFGGLYDFAGQIRNVTISKGDFTFCRARYLHQALRNIDNMPDDTFDEIVAKYVEMNVAHPFMEGNGRSTRLWLDLLLKNRIDKCIDWSQIIKRDYLTAMILSATDPSMLYQLLKNALTDKVNDRETFMKGIDYSYYYEQED
ncbi:MAG: Fic family protein [Muribaculaceae bacterium]|nr:Fic family protein [Muribaculaceae bacterium]MBR6490648.1 Fic family protein [Muribaculaceae bacterium]